MAVIDEAEVRASLRQGKVAPVYLLVGDDEVGKTPLIDALCGLVEPDLQPFNLERVYLTERTLDDAVASARTLPLLGDLRVVLVLRGEVVLKPKGRAAESADEAGEDGAPEAAPVSEPAAVTATSEFERYLASPSPETCLVLVASDMARNARLARLLARHAVVVEFWGFKSDREAKGQQITEALREAAQFVHDQAREAGLRIKAAAIAPLVEHAGADIGVLRNDVERVITYCAGRPEITEEDVRAVVAGAVQVDQWALTRAIQEGNAREALRQLHLGLEAGQSPWMLLGQLGWFVRTGLAQKAPDLVARRVDALFRADAALKSSGGDPQVLLERLVVELCGVRTRH